jgi:hypothetical protein
MGSSGVLAPWGVRVRASGRTGAVVYARQCSFAVGSPLPFDVDEERATALELFLGALGADVVAGFRALAARRRLEVDEVEATVEARLDNPLVHLGVIGEQGHPGIASVALRVHVATREPEAKMREVFDEAVRRSSLLRTIGSAAALDVVVRVTV